ncbi:hypothetical protein ACFX11_021244 [Malus domestica]
MKELSLQVTSGTKRSKSVPTRVGKPQSSHLIKKPRQKFFASGPDKLA